MFWSLNKSNTVRLILELRGARILLIDEVDIMKEHYPKFRQICGGQSVTISCKYTAAATTEPMPVVFLSNNRDVPTDEPRWISRIEQFEVKPLPANYPQLEQQIYPLGWLVLFDESMENFRF